MSHKTLEKFDEIDTVIEKIKKIFTSSKGETIKEVVSI